MPTAFDLSAFVHPDPRVGLTLLARAARSAGRYDDMCTIVRGLVEAVGSGRLEADERELFGAAFESAITERRAEWRILSPQPGDDAITKYQGMVAAEIEDLCKDALDLLENHLISVDRLDEPVSRVHYLTLAGDCYATLAVHVGIGTHGGDAAARYDAALETASEKLAPTHPLRLILARNYARFLHDVLRDTKKGMGLAKRAFDEAISKLDRLGEADYETSTAVMRDLRDDLTAWSLSEPEEETM